uniref:DNA-directed RNA polymerase n=1 Tax=Pyrodinium bahamense TaxID=73915 RepID=A0A7S0B7I5_9DINO
MDECGLPFVIAKDLFRGFLLAELENEFGGYAEELQRRELNDELLRRFALKEEEEQFCLLEKAMAGRLVILNRAPTLHRLSLQAFRPRLVRGQALTIHPLVCAPFNADFDGDTMTVHLALGQEAQAELERLMLPSRNLSSPATGDPVIGPTQDMVLGIYYLTVDPPDNGEPPRLCQSVEDLEVVAEACASGEVPHTLPVAVPRSILLEAAPAAAEDDILLSDDGSESVAAEVRTTAGRVLFFLLVHRGYRPPQTMEAALVDDLDSAPLAPVLAGALQ